ncbi:MAG: PEGA domain-containing protein [Lachnospiraceae bacterium]|nr:PEGA domain-containing protein [Lachnospiraceae bacterium]
MRRKRLLCLSLLVLGLVMAACVPESGSRTAEVPSSNEIHIGYEAPGPESYDSADTAVLVDKDSDQKTLTFLNLNRGREYTLSYDGTTKFADKYGESVSLKQIAVGDIVDVTFMKETKHLTKMMLSDQAWKNEGVARYEMNLIRGEVAIGEDIYKLTDNTRYLSEGQMIEAMDINTSDVLSFQGIDNQVLSVKVEKGHGYLRLVNDESFVGGWIEIGQSTIQRITEDMLLVLPEGAYQVNISHRGGGGMRDVIINRNEETALDIGDMEVPEAQTGMVLFSLSPSNATLYIDGTETDASVPVTLEYGIHQLIVKAEGYKSITQYIRVGQASAGVNVVLESATGSEEEEEDKDDVTDVSTGYYKVHIDSPEDAEVYVNGNYVGIAPCSFKKVSGVHVVSLRMEGYKTRSYTIQVDNEEKDITFSFAELVEIDGDVTDGDSSEDEDEEDSEEDSDKDEDEE